MAVERLARSGRDPTQFARDLLAHLRHLLVIQTVGEVPDTFVVTATDADRLRPSPAPSAPRPWCGRSTSWPRALTAVREGDEARMAVEVALLNAARPDLDPSTEGLLRRVERLEEPLDWAPRPRGPAPRRPPRSLGRRRLAAAGTPVTDATRGRHASADEQPRRPEPNP